MKTSIKLSVISLLLVIIPAHGMFRGLTTKLGNAMRSTIGARLLMAQRPRTFKAFGQATQPFKNAFKNKFDGLRTPVTLSAFGLGATQSFDDQVKEKEKEVKKVVNQKLKTLKFPLRVQELIQASGPVTRDEDYSENIQQQECNLQGICDTTRFSSDKTKKINSSLFTRTYSVREMPLKGSPKHNLLLKSLTLTTYDGEFKKCFADYPKSKENAQCKALFNIIDIDTNDTSASKLEARAQIDEQAKLQLLPVHRHTTHADGSREEEPVPGIGEAFIWI